MRLFQTISGDLRLKAEWCYGETGLKELLKTLATDGTAAMVIYRLMQWSTTHRLSPLAMAFNKLNAVCCQCIIGRRASFGPGFVLIHSQGVVINSSVVAGERIFIEHQVTIGAERGVSPVIGSDVFFGAGSKIIGSVRVGDGARVGANAVVVHDVPSGATVVGIPAKVVFQRSAPQYHDEPNSGSTFTDEESSLSYPSQPDKQ